MHMHKQRTEISAAIPRCGQAILAITAGLILAGVAAPAAHAAFATVEFSENATLINHQTIAGTDAFAPQGLHFTGSAQYVIDNRLIGAGLDDKGITTGPSSAIMGVTFDTPQSSVAFDAVSVNTDFFATAYAANNSVLDSFFVAANGTSYFSHTFSGVGDIAKVEFHDNNNFIAVGRLSAVPEPAVLGLGEIGWGELALPPPAIFPPVSFEITIEIKSGHAGIIRPA